VLVEYGRLHPQASWLKATLHAIWFQKIVRVKIISKNRISKAAPLLAGMLMTQAVSAVMPGPARNTIETQEYASRLSAARIAYFKVVFSGDAKADEQAHKALSAFEEAFPGDAIGLAYHGSLQLLDAAHSWQIWNLHKQAADGLSMLDAAVTQAPDEPEVRFLRAATDWHLPGFYHRREQSEEDFSILAAHAEEDARRGTLPPELAAASLSFWGQIQIARGDRDKARAAFEAAIQIAPESPAGVDAKERLSRLR